MINQGLFTSNKEDWGTPNWFNVKKSYLVSLEG